MESKQKDNENKEKNEIKFTFMKEDLKDMNQMNLDIYLIIKKRQDIEIHYLLFDH